MSRCSNVMFLLVFMSHSNMYSDGKYDNLDKFHFHKNPFSFSFFCQIQNCFTGDISDACFFLDGHLAMQMVDLHKGILHFVKLDVNALCVRNNEPRNISSALLHIIFILKCIAAHDTHIGDGFDERINSLRVVGRTIFLMASTFLGIGFIPDLLIQYPRYMTSSAQKVYFSAFTHNPLSFNNLKTIPIFSK
jgi:hypothetical protein